MPVALRIPMPDPLSDDDFALADGTFHVVDRDGHSHHLPGVNGYRLMEIMRDFGLDVPATCGGACLCGTCHVYLDAIWVDKLPAAQPDEEALLDHLVNTDAGSRLACQIIWDGTTLDGLNVTLAPLETV